MEVDVVDWQNKVEFVLSKDCEDLVCLVLQEKKKSQEVVDVFIVELKVVEE